MCGLLMYMCGLCRFNSRQAAASAAYTSNSTRSVRRYNFLGGLFGAQKAEMGAAGSKTEAREGWAPATGEARTHQSDCDSYHVSVVPFLRLHVHSMSYSLVVDRSSCLRHPLLPQRVVSCLI